jgi:hypothetical protein
MAGEQSRIERIESDAGDVTIPTDNWKSFLDGFSHQHDQWLTDVLVMQDGKQWVEVKGCKLEGVSPDRKVPLDERVHVVVICQNGDHLDHVVEKPSKITFRRNTGGAHVGLDIISANGSQTTLRFRAPARRKRSMVW